MERRKFIQDTAFTAAGLAVSKFPFAQLRGNDFPVVQWQRTNVIALSMIIDLCFN